MAKKQVVQSNESSKSKAPVVRLAKHACSEHAFQDSQFGVGKRFFNSSGDGMKVICTVCGTAEQR